LILEGKTGKGKNRIRENGSEWVLLQEADHVMFNPERGPWLLIRPAARTDDAKDRWIHSKHDVDFRILPDPI